MELRRAGAPAGRACSGPSTRHPVRPADRPRRRRRRAARTCRSVRPASPRCPADAATGGRARPPPRPRRARGRRRGRSWSVEALLVALLALGLGLEALLGLLDVAACLVEGSVGDVLVPCDVLAEPVVDRAVGWL